MDWIALAVVAVVMFIAVGMSSSHMLAQRRRDRLETAFHRARGHRITVSGSRF
jgi:8-oxo-dGTP pyrophosphatase MutT (NUDIX family)